MCIAGSNSVLYSLAVIVVDSQSEGQWINPVCDGDFCKLHGVLVLSGFLHTVPVKDRAVVYLCSFVFFLGCVNKVFYE